MCNTVQKLKVGLIGLGSICKHAHMLAYTNMENVEIAAICDILPERVEEFKQKYQMPDVPGFTDYRELLEVEGLDFVDIATPNKFHSIIAVAALEKGLHVICEKPDAVSVEEALKMKNAAERSGKHLMVMRNNRHRKTAKYLKNYILEGKMGDIYCGRCGWQRRRGIPGKGGWFTTKELSGGGPLIDLGVHMIDLAIWFMGNPKPVAVTGCTYCKFADSDISDSEHSKFGDKAEDGIFDVEDLAMGFIRFENGACLQIEFSWASNIEEETVFVELRGTKAGAELKNEMMKIFSEHDGCLVDELPRVKDSGYEHVQNIGHFLDVVLGKTEPDFLPEQGVNMIKILEAMYLSAEKGREISLAELEG